VIHKFDSDEDWKTELDNYYEIISLFPRCRCCECRSSQKAEAACVPPEPVCDPGDPGAKRGLNDNDNSCTSQKAEAANVPPENSVCDPGAPRNLSDKSAIDNSGVKQEFREIWRTIKDVERRVVNLGEALGENSCEISDREEEQIDIDLSTSAMKRFSYLIAIMVLLAVLSIFLIRIRKADLVVKPTESHLKNSGRTLDFRGFRLHRDIKNKDSSEHQCDDTHTYSACQMRWGNLSALDHAILANMAYYQPELLEPNLETAEADLKAVKLALNFTFPNPSYDVSLVEDWKTNQQRITDAQDGTFNKYYRFDFKGRNHTVIAVQGTDPDDRVDLFTDIRLWFVSAFMGVAQLFIIPLNLLLPHQRADLQWLIHWVHEHMTIEEGKLDAYAPVVKYVRDIVNGSDHEYRTHKNNCLGVDCWTISVTGHSLGGGIATIVGSTLGIPSVSFSGPGLYYSKWQFETKTSDEVSLHPDLAEAVNLGTTFMPSNDVVPRVDGQIGNIQHTACSVKNSLHCHLISTMICDLLHRCGDDQHRERFRDCSGTKQTFNYTILQEIIFP